MHLQPGTLLQGRYRIDGLIAQGGMGAVYRAADERLGNTVALKQTLMADPSLRAAFEREARLLAGLHHPALPVVSDHFVEDGGQFLVMQFIPGDDLATLLQRRGTPFALAEVLPWADRLLDALDYLHSRTPPVIHRDVKPQNLKLTARGELVLLDFGLAKGEPAGATAANPSLFGYTPQYAPLEQIQGSGTDARSDLYAVAATLYELLTGAAPADALSRAAAAVRGEPDPLRPAHERNPHLPPALSDLLGQALTLNPALRPPSAATMREALHTTARGEVGATIGATVAALPAAVSTTTIAERRQPAEQFPTPQLPPPQPPTPQPTAAKPARPWLLPALLALGAAGTLLLLAAFLTPMGGSGGAASSPPTADSAPGLGATALPAATIGALPGGTRDPGGPTGTTRAAPLPAGTAVEIPGWTVAVSEVVRGPEANQRMALANQFNDVPPDGMEYVLLYVRATSTKTAAQFAFSQSDVRLVGSRDVAHRSSGVAPSPRLDSSEQVPPGASVEGWAPYLVGTEERDLVVILGDLLGGSARMMSLTPGARLDPDPDAPAVVANNIGADIREPAEVGQVAVTDLWAISLEELVVGEKAWARILERYRGAEPPAQGMQYVLAYVRARYLGPSDEPRLIADSHFVGMAGEDEVEQPVVLVPEPELFGVLFPGGSAEGWVVLLVPADDTALIAFRGAGISTGRRDGWRFFAAQ